jgi:hypothetical protein
VSDINLVKDAYSKYRYTNEQLLELQKCADPVTGPRYFIEHYIYVQHPKKGRIKLELFDYQIELLDVYHNNRKAIAMMARQLGKTTVAAAYLLWFAMFNPDTTVVVAAHKHAGALEIMQRIRYAYENIPDYIRAGVTSYNKKSIDFDNGARILSQTTTENTGRGLSISLIYLDEFAFVRPSIAAELWTSLSPTLATGGKCIITSTPNTDEDQFSSLWFDANETFDQYGKNINIGKNGFKSYLATWDRHPDRGTKWEDEERQAIGDQKFEQEHNCAFVGSEETLIDSAVLYAMKGNDPILITHKNVRWFKEIDPSLIYLISLDPAVGTGSDNAAIQVVEMPSMIQVAEWMNNKTQVEGQIKVLQNIALELEKEGCEDIYWTVENNSLGEAALVCIREVGQENIPGMFISDPETKRQKGSNRKGFNTTNRKKLEACVKFKRYVDSGMLKINSGPLISELKNFVSNENTYKAKSGLKDDLVSAMLLSIRMFDVVSRWEPGLLDSINNKEYLDYDDLYESDNENDVARQSNVPCFIG